MNNSTILITGAAGFIGFHAAKELRSRGASVIGIDNFNNYYSQDLKRTRASILKEIGIPVYEIDLNHKEKFRSLFETIPFSHVLHLAAQAGVRHAREHPEDYLRSNIDGFISLLELLKSNPKIKLVYASSSSVYGCNRKIPFSVNDVTDSPSNLYAATKKANELMAYSYHHLYGIPMTGLRYFTVYGPWGRPDMAYYHFTQSICEGKPICLYNNGLMQRDFTYIDDAIQGTVAALECVDKYSVFNLGNNQPIDLLRFVAILEQELGIEAIRRYKKADPDEIPTTYADISLAQEQLGYQPKTPIEQGLQKFIQWYRSYYQI